MRLAYEPKYGAIRRIYFFPRPLRHRLSGDGAFRFRIEQNQPEYERSFGRFKFFRILTNGVKTISTFLNDIKLLSRKKALKSYAKAHFSNDIRQ